MSLMTGWMWLPDLTAFCLDKRFTTQLLIFSVLVSGHLSLHSCLVHLSTAAMHTPFSVRVFSTLFSFRPLLWCLSFSLLQSLPAASLWPCVATTRHHRSYDKFLSSHSPNLFFPHCCYLFSLCFLHFCPVDENTVFFADSADTIFSLISRHSRWRGRLSICLWCSLTDVLLICCCDHPSLSTSFLFSLSLVVEMTGLHYGCLFSLPPLFSFSRRLCLFLPSSLASLSLPSSLSSLSLHSPLSSLFCSRREDRSSLRVPWFHRHNHPGFSRHGQWSIRLSNRCRPARWLGNCQCVLCIHTRQLLRRVLQRYEKRARGEKEKATRNGVFDLFDRY